MNKNKIMHGVVLVVVGGAGCFLALILKLPLMVVPATARMAKMASIPQASDLLPPFTRLCMSAGPVLLGAMGLLCLGYCIYVWARKAERSCSWVGFLATAMSALFVVLLPCVVAIYLPLVGMVNRLQISLP